MQTTTIKQLHDLGTHLASQAPRQTMHEITAARRDLCRHLQEIERSMRDLEALS